MKKLTLLTSLTAFLVSTIFAASLYAQSEPKYVSMPGDKYYQFGDDPMRYIENDRVKVGFNLAIGGAVVYLEDKANNSGNMINSFDWGRQIQLSYYSGPHPFIGPNGEKPSDNWAALGWNPIQAGDCGGYGSRVLTYKQRAKDEAFVRARPMLWPNIGVLAECVFECEYKLTDNGFKLTATIVNNRSDKTQYSAHGQETPALYTNAPWYKLVTYLGDKPFQNEPTTTIVDKNDGNGWPWLNYYTPERWSALVNENNYGVGVYQPNAVRTAAGFHGGDAPKGQNLGDKSGPTGYIAPLETTILDWNIKRSYTTTFIVGSLDEIRAAVYELAKKDIPDAPSWLFNTDRNNWTYENATDEGCNLNGGGLVINLNPDKAAVAKSPDTFWLAENTKTLKMTGDYLGADEEPIDALTVVFTPVSPADSQFYLQWSEGGKDAAKDRAEKEKTFPRLPEIAFNVPVRRSSKGWSVNYDLSSLEGYKGAMRQMRVIIPQNSGRANLKSVILK